MNRETLWRLDMVLLVAAALAVRKVRTLASRARRGDVLEVLGAEVQQPRLFDNDGNPAPSLTPESAPKSLACESVPLPTIDDVLRDLATKQARLSQYIESCLDKGVDVAELARLFALHGQNASRLGRLLRDQLALDRPNGLAGAPDDPVSQAIALSLEELEQALGVDL